MFSEDEQEEISETVLNNQGQMIEEKIEEKIKREYSQHIKELSEIKTTEYVSVKKAMLRYIEQTGHNAFRNCGNYSYGDRWWQETFKTSKHILNITKQGNRYVCSKERLDAINFNIFQKIEINTIIVWTTTGKRRWHIEEGKHKEIKWNMNYNRWYTILSW